ncbi:DEAD/DEAH box helicase family protein [Rathayibacter sp. VKM Ac-2759]|uniref:type I restriction endonuclease subunit R n=1 Tax=Rathayibacter sp. VKM Ac-2759 TaxID=2609252 RepID=UPI0013170E41|nr:DEAD/DEAH box helicase family protein [Rathayibacter sp. VKM Ac-2759]QHC67883.1 DEAD/DEAH box helicase family protein [Rathayibacter sp. VKM Ac-2759]
MSANEGDRLAAEQRARVLIDRQLDAAGWAVQDRAGLNLYAASGVAVREVHMKAGHGRVDYLLYLDRRVVGVIEAKPVGTPLAGVEWQSAMYATGLPTDVRLSALTKDGRLPFVFEASGGETRFTNGYDPEPRARLIFHFPKAETLARTIRDAEDSTGDEPATWRGRVHAMPPLAEAGMRDAQIEAVTGIEKALRNQQFSRSLVQMATGAGKTFTAVTESYRLLKWGGFNRVLFLVDRNNLGDQTLGEFQNYRTPDDGRRFTELYNVGKLTRAGMPDSTKVAISTIQRVFKVIKNEAVPEGDDSSLDDFIPAAPVEVAYNAALPPETFDLVIVDEAHRSIYGVWRRVLEYFDAHVIGLTATPGKQTFGFFQQNLVSEYTYTESVADGVNVDFDIYRIKTDITENGSLIEAGTIVPKVDKRTRLQRLEALDADLEYSKAYLDRAVTAKSQIRLVLETFRERLFTEIFPGRRVVPKTLIFAKDDNHAEEIVQTVREVFGKGNDFAAKITYSAKDPKGQLKAFRTSPTLRIAVTVDMIATGTDVKPLECVFFMRDVRSAQYFEQMKGRGSRTIDDATFQAVTEDAASKTRFVIVDAIGVTEHDFVEPPLNREKGISLEKLLGKAASMTLTEDETATLASRLAALEQQVTPAERTELDDVAERPLRQIVRGLVDAVNSDLQAAVIEANPGTDPAKIVEDLLQHALRPIAANPDLRTRILELRRSHDQTIDEVSADHLLDAYGVMEPDRAKSTIESWRAYLAEHRSEIGALELMFDAKGRGIGFADIQELADRIARPPYRWTVDLIWNAYLSVGVEYRGRPETRDRHTLTDLISLLRYETVSEQALVPYSDQVMENYANWLARQDQGGASFTDSQLWWLDRIVQVVVNSAGIDADDLDEAPFTERGGIDGALRDLGDGAGELVDELNRELTA